MKAKAMGMMVVMMMVGSSSAWAEHDEYEGDDDQYDYARVISVEPIIERVEVREPDRECWNEEIRSIRGGREYSVPRSTVAGGLIGGLIGSQFGRGNGRIVTTVAGTFLGAALGHETAQWGNRRSYPYEEVRDVRRCRVIDRVRTEERVCGYWVDYKYRGQTHRTRTEERPGSKIRVRVNVEPVAF